MENVNVETIVRMRIIRVDGTIEEIENFHTIIEVEEENGEYSKNS